MVEEDMSLQLSMALSGINSEEWKEFKELYEEGRATLNRLRRSSDTCSLNDGSSDSALSSVTSTEIEEEGETCLKGATWGASLSPFALEAHYRCIKQIMKHIKNKNYIKQNNMEIIKIFTDDETKALNLKKSSEADNRHAVEEETQFVEATPEEEGNSVQEAKHELEECENEKYCQEQSEEKEKNCGLEENYGKEEKLLNDEETNSENKEEDELEPKIDTKPKPLDEPEYTELPYPINSFKIIWTARNLLDLSTNLLTNADMYIPARIPRGVPEYFENRSQISRMKGAIPPPHTMTRCSLNGCGFEESFFN